MNPFCNKFNTKHNFGRSQGRTTSATVYVNPWTYIFLNQPDTNYIDWIRFQDPKKPTNGKIGGDRRQCRPISAYRFDDKSIRLFYTGKISEHSPFAGFTSIRELRLPAADQETTNPSNWQNASQAPELTFEHEVVEQLRLSDKSSFLSLSLGNDGGMLLPAVVWKTADSSESFEYGVRKKDGTWDLTKFKLPK